LVEPNCGKFQGKGRGIPRRLLAELSPTSHIYGSGREGEKAPARLGILDGEIGVSFFVGFVIFGC